MQEEKKTFNDIRKEHGLERVEGGDVILTKKWIEFKIYIPYEFIERERFKKLLNKLDDQLKEYPHTKIEIICGKPS